MSFVFITSPPTQLFYPLTPLVFLFSLLSLSSLGFDFDSYLLARSLAERPNLLNKNKIKHPQHDNECLCLHLSVFCCTLSYFCCLPLSLTQTHMHAHARTLARSSPWIFFLSPSLPRLISSFPPPSDRFPLVGPPPNHQLRVPSRCTSVSQPVCPCVCPSFLSPPQGVADILFWHCYILKCE